MERYREFTVTFDTDDYLCHSGHGLELDDVIAEILDNRNGKNDVPRPDMVIWEDGRILAVIRARNGVRITRFESRDRAFRPS